MSELETALKLAAEFRSKYHRHQDTLSEIIPALEKATGLKADDFRGHARGDLTGDEVAALWMARAILEKP